MVASLRPFRRCENSVASWNTRQTVTRGPCLVLCDRCAALDGLLQEIAAALHVT